MKDTIDAAKEYIERLFAGNADGHGLDHSMRVYKNAMLLAETELTADRFIVALSALLHDADDYKLFQTENNANARNFLKSANVDPETTDRICEVINSVSFSKNRGKKPETIEGQIVQDADRLDAIGAIGIDHFHEKLLLLKDMLNTEKAKELAESRHRFMEQFLKEWEKETGAK